MIPTRVFTTVENAHMTSNDSPHPEECPQRLERVITVENYEGEQGSPVMSTIDSASEGYKMIQSLMETDRAELFSVAPRPRERNSVSKEEWELMVEDFKRNQALNKSAFPTSSEGFQWSNETLLNSTSQDPPSTIQKRYPQCASSSSSDVIFMFVDPIRSPRSKQNTTTK